MSDRYPVSNQQRGSSTSRQQQQAGSLQRAPLKIGHSGSFRGVHTNVGPNQTGYDHMYATDIDNGQLQQQVALSEADTDSASSDNVNTAISEVHFLKEFLLMHLDLIQQQNEDILHKDNIIIKLQQENASLQQRLQQSIAQQNSQTAAHSTAGTILAVIVEPQTTPGDYSPESIPPTEDVLAPDVGDDMTLAEPVAPPSPDIIISNNVTLTVPTAAVSTPVTSTCAVDQQLVVVCAASGVSASLPEASVPSKSSVANCFSVSRASSEIVIIEDDSTDTVVATELPATDLVSGRDLSARVEPFSEIVAGPQGTLIHEHTTNTPTSASHKALCSPNLVTAPSLAETGIRTTVTNTITARYSVVLNSVASDSGEPNTKNLRMSIRRKRLGSGSSPSNIDYVPLEEVGDASESKGGSSSYSLGSGSGKVTSRSKRKRLNGHILTFPQEYVTSVGEANVDVLRHQALADEVIKAVNLEVPHWRVKVYADSYHLEGTENLDDEVFLKRHSRLENDERRRKRWDVQRIREQRLVEKLKQRQTKTHQLNTDHGQSKIATNGGVDGRPESLDGHEAPASLWPAPEHDLQYIEVTDNLPVGAFGVPLPAIVPREFSIPWLGSDQVQSASGEVVEAPIGTQSESNNGRKSVGSRKSGGLTKRRSKR